MPNLYTVTFYTNEDMDDEIAQYNNVPIPYIGAEIILVVYTSIREAPHSSYTKELISFKVDKITYEYDNMNAFVNVYVHRIPE